MSAKEFRDTWLKINPNVIHIPSEHELGLMEGYAKYYYEMNRPEDDSSMLFHECPNCNCRCNCSSHPCSCCDE